MADVNPDASAKPLVVPEKGADASQYKNFFDRFADPDSPARKERISEWMVSKAMTESVQWLQQMKSQVAGRVPRWIEQAQNVIPQPVQNEILPLVINEVAKLSRKKSKGRVRSRVQRMGQEGAAKAGDEILEWHLDSIKWPRIRRRSIYRNVIYGTMLLKSHWELSYAETVTVGLPDGAMACAGQPSAWDQTSNSMTPSTPGCGFTVASNTVNPQQAAQLATTDPEKAASLSSDVENEYAEVPKVSYSFDSCLDCGGGLTDTVPNPDQAKTKDMFGRPLGKKVPKGNAKIEDLAPWEVYFENEGLGVEPDTMREFVIVQIKSLPWIKSHFKHPDLQKLNPEDQRVLVDQAPILGEYDEQSSGARGADKRNLYTNHARVRSYYAEPEDEEDLGRYVVLVGNVVAVDDTLCVWGDDGRGGKQKIPRCKLGIARFWRRDGEMSGMPITNPLLSPQKRINMMFSQIVDSRERNVDFILSTPGMKMRSPGNTAGLSGSRVIFDPDPEFPEGPKFIGARTMDAGVYTEHGLTRTYMQEAVGAQAADLGKIPQSSQVPALLIKTLQDQIAIQREEREEEIKDCFEEIYSHQMLLLQRFAQEPRQYEVMGTGEQWEERSFMGSDLVGQTDIKVEEEASYDKDAYDREMIVKADQMQLLSKDSPIARHEILEALGISTKLSETQNVQIEDAARKWAKFKDEGIVPVVEPTQDAHSIKFDYYATALFGDDGVELKSKAGWDAIVPALAGWEDKLAKAILIDQQVRQMQATVQAPPAPPAMTNGEPMHDQQEQTRVALDEQKRAFAQQALGTMDVQNMLLPPDPVGQVVTVWTRMLASREMTLTPAQQPFLAFEATVETHRRLAQAALQTPAPQVAAPGTAGPAAAVASTQPAQPAAA